ncbi:MULTISPECIES: hypothetical protein [Aquidulcibacter]|jgi:hypothetical protein|uniref:hypothetical protein n=1 Tax=Aquidulcibacter TaxID=2052989 RepID=UPI000A18FB9E|nr:MULTISPECIES: hypothetical protein [Aquidulcibacter]MCA3694906.1 hypothetical protein [Aquidulcibacter sp.]
MILHASISAGDPKHVASVLAELWDGEALPFAPVSGAWIAMAGDERGSGIEVYPRGRALVPGVDDAMFDTTDLEQPARYGATHLAIQCHKPQSAIEAIAQRENWRSVRCSRGGMFDVIEFWIENSTMIEVLTSEMQRDYQATSSIEAWREAIGHMA